MMWRLPFCRMNRHRADKATIVWNGTWHVANCPDCGKLVRKSSRKQYWKLVEALEVEKYQ